LSDEDREIATWIDCLTSVPIEQISGIA
jgi:hypothetical protein